MRGLREGAFHAKGTFYANAQKYKIPWVGKCKAFWLAGAGMAILGGEREGWSWSSRREAGSEQPCVVCGSFRFDLWSQYCWLCLLTSVFLSQTEDSLITIAMALIVGGTHYGHRVLMLHTCLGDMLPIKANFQEGPWFMVMTAWTGPFVPAFSGWEPGVPPFIEILRRCLGQTDPGWGPIFTTWCVTLCKLLQLSQTWFLVYKMEKIIGSTNEIIIIIIEIIFNIKVNRLLF